MSKFSKLLPVICLVVLLVISANASGITPGAGDGSVQKHGDGYFADAFTVFDEGVYASVSAFLYFIDADGYLHLQDGRTHPYDTYVGPQIYIDTGVRVPNPNHDPKLKKAKYRSYHQLGSDADTVDYEWSGKGSINITYSNTSFSSFSENEINDDYIINDFSSSLASHYKLNTNNLININFNSTDKLIKLMSNDFYKRFTFDVELPYQLTMRSGDYAPCYWFDFNSKTVYIGHVSNKGIQSMYYSTWTVEGSNISFSKLINIE